MQLTPEDREIERDRTAPAQPRRRLSNQLRALMTTVMIAARTAASRYTHGSATVQAISSALRCYCGAAGKPRHTRPTGLDGRIGA